MVKEDKLGALVTALPTCCSITPTLRCCCGRTDCAVLKHNCVALDDLEQEVRTAASLGQALLVRHEQYMYDAEQDRLEMGIKIEKLEADKRLLEDENARSIEENRGLLDQLEGLNETVAESETHVKSLEATLYSTRQELRRLELLASRTHNLELQLSALEQEQDLLQRTITTTQKEERSAIQRWRKAERRLCDIQEQLERIEREAREEREKHVEVIGRMERQRSVERELDTAAGRLKGAAATATTGCRNNGSSVVSHFVKDILQDNANLQMGVIELREMLMNSNDEVQTLREQLLLHQPIFEDGGEDSGQSTLRAELAPNEEKEPRIISQALHIHHHYHAPKKEETRRPKKKRTSLNTALFTPPSKGIKSPKAHLTRNSASMILSETSVTIPAPITPSNRWSVQSGQMSDFAPSSVPSSPQSIYRQSGLFDRLDIDSSRPTSPSSSIDPMSPQFQPLHHRKRGSEVSMRSFIPPTKFQPHVIQEEENRSVENLPSLHPSISLEDDTTPLDLSHDTEYLSSDNDQDRWTAYPHSRLRHSLSHESTLSISGIDIHTLKSRPSQITIRGGSALLRPRSRLGTPTTNVSIESLTVTPRATMSRQAHDSTTYLRSMRENSSDSRSTSSTSNDGIKTKLGGWVFGRWGVTPQKSSADLKTDYLSPNSRPKLQQRAVSTPVVDPLKSFMGRAPGINQKGPIPGFAKRAERAPSRVKPDTIDHDALREVLMEGRSP
ncbi:hypothetical protein BUE80_DR008826 [Diplocarpon rosae]|nr:hypothetical protein BUE80_DR008826 [Diplocarpon rosae]